ncbi:MAG: hypothetical protein PHV77_03685 [Candidatus Omnitrophica bacterium]|jgi:hypothetical protein|nr:hypothetical protein [Candidatus Omnitrophota bacterium]
MEKVEHIKFTLFDNAFDFITSAQEYIAHKKSRSLKYAILHLYADVELVSKECLKMGYWSLLFEDINKANIKDYESGNFMSVRFNATIVRLKGICKISFVKKDEEILSHFRDKRN